jgi:hypothetical protein
MTDGEYEEFGRQAERTFEGVSRGPGASLDKAIQQAARAAAEAGYTGVPFTVIFVSVEPQEHNQWVRTFSVLLTPGS